MDPRQQVRCLFSVVLKIGDSVPVGIGFQRQVAQPTIGVNSAAGFDAVLNERKQARRRSVSDVPQPNASDPTAILLGRHYDQRLVFRLSTAHPFLGASQIALIHLDGTCQPFATGPDHRPPQLMQTSPSRLVAAPSEHLL